MKIHFLKHLYAKRAFALFLVFTCIVCFCCGCKKESEGYYSKSDNAVQAIEDAVYILDRCIEEKITVETCVEQLERVEKEYEPYCEGDDILRMAILRISICANGISTAKNREKIGSISIASVMREVQGAKDELADMLKN